MKIPSPIKKKNKYHKIKKKYNHNEVVTHCEFCNAPLKSRWERRESHACCAGNLGNYGALVGGMFRFFCSKECCELYNGSLNKV